MVQLRATAPAFDPREPSTPVRQHAHGAASTTPKTLQPGTAEALPASIQRLRRIATTPSRTPSAASSGNTARTLALASAPKYEDRVKQTVLASERRMTTTMKEGFATANKGIADANQGIGNIQKELLGQTAEAQRRAAEAEKRRAELETELAVTKVEMQQKDEIAKRKEAAQAEIISQQTSEINFHRQMSAIHHGQTNSCLRSFQHQLDEMNSKNDNNAADMMEQLETLQFDLADLEKHVTAKSDEEKERYELERMRIEKRLDGLSATLRLLGQPGKMIQQVDELKATSKEEHSLRLQAESEIADLEQKVKVLSARIRNLDATTSSNGRKSMPAIKDEAKDLSVPTDHVDIGDAKAPATSSTRPILGNRDANTDLDAAATTDAGDSVRDLVKGASGDIN